MKKLSLLLLTTLLAIGYSGWGQIIISQYYEGYSNNKWIEITNVGDATVDLNDYYLGRWSNTETPSGAATNSSQMTGLSIDAGEVLLFQHEEAVLPDYASGNNSEGCFFNGDDPIAICDGSTNWDDRVDCIYSTGTWGSNKSFYRKSNVVTANTGISTLDGTGEWTEPQLLLLMMLLLTLRSI